MSVIRPNSALSAFDILDFPPVASPAPHIRLPAGSGGLRGSCGLSSVVPVTGLVELGVCLTRPSELKLLRLWLQLNKMNLVYLKLGYTWWHSKYINSAKIDTNIWFIGRSRLHGGEWHLPELRLCSSLKVVCLPLMLQFYVHDLDDSRLFLGSFISIIRQLPPSTTTIIMVIVHDKYAPISNPLDIIRNMGWRQLFKALPFKQSHCTLHVIAGEDWRGMNVKMEEMFRLNRCFAPGMQIMLDLLQSCTDLICRRYNFHL